MLKFRVWTPVGGVNGTIYSISFWWSTRFWWAGCPPLLPCKTPIVSLGEQSAHSLNDWRKSAPKMGGAGPGCCRCESCVECGNRPLFSAVCNKCRRRTRSLQYLSLSQPRRRQFERRPLQAESHPSPNHMFDRTQEARSSGAKNRFGTATVLNHDLTIFRAIGSCSRLIGNTARTISLISRRCGLSHCCALSARATSHKHRRLRWSSNAKTNPRRVRCPGTFAWSRTSSRQSLAFRQKRTPPQPPANNRGMSHLQRGRRIRLQPSKSAVAMK